MIEGVADFFAVPCRGLGNSALGRVRCIIVTADRRRHQRGDRRERAGVHLRETGCAIQRQIRASQLRWIAASRPELPIPRAIATRCRVCLAPRAVNSGKLGIPCQRAFAVMSRVAMSLENGASPRNRSTDFMGSWDLGHTYASGGSRLDCWRWGDVKETPYLGGAWKRLAKELAFLCFQRMETDGKRNGNEGPKLETNGVSWKRIGNEPFRFPFPPVGCAGGNEVDRTHSVG